MYSRGQFAVMGNVGRKALRLYHEEGLLVPAYTSEENGYHYYSDEQLLILERIKQYRKLGLSLYEIKQIINGNADEKEILESKIIETDNLLKEIKEYSQESNREDGTITEEQKVDITAFGSYNCIYVIENIERENLGMSIGKLYEKASREKIDVDGDHFVIFDKLDKPEFTMTTCLPVKNYGGYDSIEIYEEKCLHINFKGGFSKVWKAHKQLKKYAEEKGIELKDRIYEKYNKDMSVDIYYVTK
jgi:DNA-binding transcriptional MerR regulator